MKHFSVSRVLGALLFGTVLITLTLVATTVTPATAQPRSVTPDPAALASLTICFVSDNQTACVDRAALSTAATITDEVRTLTQQLLSGPTQSELAAGVVSALPPGTRLDAVSVTDGRVSIDLSLAAEALAALTDQQVEDINEQFRTTFTPYNFQRIDLNARRGDWRAISLALRFLAADRDTAKRTRQAGSPPPARAEEEARVGVFE